MKTNPGPGKALIGILVLKCYFLPSSSNRMTMCLTKLSYSEMFQMSFWYDDMYSLLSWWSSVIPKYIPCTHFLFQIDTRSHKYTYINSINCISIIKKKWYLSLSYPISGFVCPRCQYFQVQFTRTQYVFILVTKHNKSEQVIFILTKYRIRHCTICGAL